ncbi:MAG: insulinase family protein [Nannocystaceae bacterium]
MPRRRPLHRLTLSLCAALPLALACHPKGSDTPGGGETPPADAAATDALATSNLPPLQEKAIAGDPMGVTVHRLKNGMTVYISTDRQKPQFSAWIAVRAGSRNDPADSTGLAHYLEHMLFKGTDELGTVDISAERPHLERIAQLYDRLRTTDDPAARTEIFAEIDRETQATAKTAIPNELSRIYGSLGIDGLNAFTSDDMTVYVADIPQNRLEAWAETEIERFRDATFRLFYPELESVYEEKNLSIDSPWRRISEATRGALFPGHPYGTQPTIGLVEHLKTPAYKDMVDYFKRWYAPNNMAILLAGDIDAATALPVLERTLGTLEPRALEKPAAGDLAPVKGRVFREVIAEGEESVSIAWRTVSDVDLEEPTLVVLDWLMDNASSGLLNLELELTQKVPDASSGATTLREAGYWTARATAREGQSLEEVEQLLLGVVAKLKAGEFKQETIDAILLHQDMGDKQRLESNDGRVSKLLDAYISRRTWAQILERDQRLRQVKKADVVAAANKYLGDDRVVVYRRKGKPDLPKIDKPKITPLSVDGTLESAFAKKIEAMPAKELEPEWLVEGKHFERRSLPTGPLIVAKNTRNDLFSVMIAVERGQRRDKLLCHAFRLLELSGTADKSAEQLREELYALGTSINFNCGADETSIDVSGLDRNMDASMKLLGEWLGGAKFDAETLKSLNDNTISTRQDQLDDANYLGAMLREYAFFGDMSDFKAEPKNSDLLAAKPEALAKLVRGFLDYKQQVYYFGPRGADEVQKALVLGAGTKDPGAYPKMKYRALKKPTIYFVHKDVAKTSVSLAIPEGVLPRERRPEALVLSEYIGGDMSSLLFQEIREARGLAYYAGGRVGTGGRLGDEWAYSGGMGTQADKTVEAVKTYLEVIQRPLDAGRLADAKKAMDQRYRATRVDPRWMVYWIRYWDLRGDKSDPRPEEWKASAALEVAGVQPLADTLKARPAILSLVGDRGRIDLSALSGVGQVVEVKPADLASFGAFPKAKAPAKEKAQPAASVAAAPAK